MSDLPAGWEWARLDDVAEVRLGRQRSPKNHTGNQMRPYLRAANVGWQGLRLDDVKMMNFTDDEAQTYRLEYDDIVVSEASGSPGEVGKPALWRGEIEGCCLQNTLIRVRSSGSVEPSYLLRFLWAEAHRGAFAERSRGVGIHHLGSGQLAEWIIPVPPLAEQRRITAFLDEQLPHLEVGARSLEDISRALDELWNAVLGGIYRAGLLNERTPYLSPLVELAEIEGGIQKQPKRRPVVNKYPFLRVANVSRGNLDLNEVHEIELFGGELERYSLRAGDLLVVEGNGSPGQIGRAAMWHGEIENCVHQNHLIRVRPGINLNGRFLELIWNSPPTVRQLRRIASSTSGLHTLSSGKLKALNIPAPPLDSQLELVASAEEWKMRIQRLREALLRSSMRTKQLSRVLMADVFAGRLVPQDPNDEPASVLLERIEVEVAAQPKARRARRTPKNPNPEQESLL